MRILMVLFILNQTSALLKAQEKHPAGCYMSFDELRKKESTRKCTLVVERKSKGEVFMMGGNDFILYSEDKSVKGKTIRNEMWAYSDGYHLYLNGNKLHLTGGYVEVIDQGRFLVFYGGALMDEANESILGGGIAAGATALDRYLYAVDLKTGMLHTATRKYISEILQEFPQLLEKYDKEIDKESDKTILTYLNLCNQIK